MPEQTLADNLQRLKDSKTDIGNAIIAKGGTVGTTDGLEEFADDIMSIKNDLTSIDITENGTYYSGDETVVTSSAFPIVINDSNGTPVRHVVINGNAVQSGIPTPDNPIIPQGVCERTGNLWNENYTDISVTIYYLPLYVGSQVVTMSTTTPLTSNGFANLFLIAGQASSGATTDDHGVYSGRSLTVRPVNGYVTIAYRIYENVNPQNYDTMLNEGNIALPYEPYGYKIPISSANTTTPVYLGEVETTRKIKKLVLTGEEIYIKDSGGEYLYYIYKSIHMNQTYCFCSHLVHTKNYPKYEVGCFTYGNSSVIYLNFGGDVMDEQPSGNTVDGIKEYIAAQYAAGTPVTIWYVLAEPKTGIVNEPLMKIGDYEDSLSVDVELPLLQNTKNNIDVNTTLKPSSASFTYNKLSEYIGYNEINVDVSNTYTTADEGKVVNNATLVPQTAMSAEITVNDTYDTTLYNSIVVNVPSAPSPTPSVESNDVKFYDYDGTIVHSYSASEFANLSAMPNNPTHTGLTAQGWNWSLADAKTYVAKYGSLDIGQMYVTSDGKTKIYISLPEGRTSPILQLYLNANSELDIDWGDGSTHSTFTSTSANYKSERHEYSASGDYVIAITVVSGGFVLQSSSTVVSSILWNGNNNANSPDKAYNSTIKKVEIGGGVTSIGITAFSACYSLSSITIPDSVTSIGSTAFYNCSSLSSITIPDSVTSISQQAFYNCYSLSSITIPDSVTSIGQQAFQNCSYMSYIKFESTTPPFVTNSSAWSGVSTSTKILVPTGTLETYKSATNYPNPSSYTYEEY